MVIQLPGGKKGERQLERILQPAKDRAIDQGLPEIPDAAKVIALIEKDIAGLRVSGRMMRKCTIRENCRDTGVSKKARKTAKAGHLWQNNPNVFFDVLRRY